MLSAVPSNEPHRQYFICQSSKDIALVMLHDKTSADKIFYKKFGTGYLILLKYLAGKEKKHSTVDNSVLELDGVLMGTSGTTSFISVSDVGSGKVKSFSGTERLKDYHFCEIFNVKQRQNKEYVLREGVKTWDLATHEEEERSHERARETDDLLKQQQSMEEDPEAYGGSTVMDGGSKMMAAAVDSSAGGAVVNEVQDKLEEALAVERLRVEELLASKAAVDQELLGVREELDRAKTTNDSLIVAQTAHNEMLVEERRQFGVALATEKLRVKELLDSKAAVDAELLAVKEKLDRTKTTNDSLLAAQATHDAALAVGRKRVEQAESVMGELGTQRNNLMLHNAELKRGLDDANAAIANFPKQLSDAMLQKHRQFESEGNAIVRAAIANQSVALEERHRKEVEKLVKGMEHDMRQQIGPLQLRVGSLEVENKNLKAQTSALKEDLRVATRDLSDAKRKVKNMQKSKGDGESVDAVDAVEERAADAATIDRLNAELRHALSRADTAEASVSKLSGSLKDEKRRRVEESIAAKSAVEEALQAGAQKERSEQLTKFAEAQREFNRQLSSDRASLEKEANAQAQAYQKHVQSLMQDAMAAETRWQGDAARMESEIRRLQDELMKQSNHERVAELKTEHNRQQGERIKQLGGEVSALKEKLAGAGLELEDMKTKLSDLRVREAELVKERDEALCRAMSDHDAAIGPVVTMVTEAVRALAVADNLPSEGTIPLSQHTALLNAERAKVQALEQKLVDGAAASATILSLTQRLEGAELSAGEQAKRATRAELERDEVRKEMQMRVDGAGMCLGDYHAAWQQNYNENKALHSQLVKAERLRQEAENKVEESKRSELRAYEELAEVQGDLGRIRLQLGGGSLLHRDEEIQRLTKKADELDQKCLSETSSRRLAESKVANLELANREGKDHIVRLQASLRDVEGRAAELGSIMRSGPFRFGRGW